MTSTIKLFTTVINSEALLTRRFGAAPLSISMGRWLVAATNLLEYTATELIMVVKSFIVQVLKDHKYLEAMKKCGCRLLKIFF